MQGEPSPATLCSLYIYVQKRHSLNFTACGLPNALLSRLGPSSKLLESGCCGSDRLPRRKLHHFVCKFRSFFLPLPTPRSKNRNQSLHTDIHLICPDHKQLWEKVPGHLGLVTGMAETRRHRSTYSGLHSSLTSTTTFAQPPTVCTPTWKLHSLGSC